MNKTIRWENIFVGWRKRKSLFTVEKPGYLFTKRPILHQDFTVKFVQDAIRELQDILQNKSLLSNTSGKFDSETVEAVKEFQRQNNLHVDGIVGPLTWACLCYPKLSFSNRNLETKLQDAVYELQNILSKEGTLKKEPDRYFDKQTERAVKCFQRIYGLKDDGIVGLKQKLSPNVAQTGFISGEYVTIMGQPIKKSKRHSRSKSL